MRFLTAGESHGPMLVGILEGLPAGLLVDVDQVNAALTSRQGGYGRGARMTKIETDRVQVVGGLRAGRTTGAPLAVLIENRDWKNWKGVMDPVGPVSGREVHRPRPGHADLTGRLKYGFADLRDALERASARETAMRVALGAVARQYLARFGVDLLSHVVQLGGIAAWPPEPESSPSAARPKRGAARPAARPKPAPRSAIARLKPLVLASPVRCADAVAGRRMVARIEAARAAGDTLGGIFELVVEGVVPGLGGYTQWDRRLDGRLGQALLSVPAVKGVEVGDAFAGSARHGTEVHDPIAPAKGTSGPSRYSRPTNHAGGLEGGITNGEPIVLRAAMKPISTTMKGIASVDIRTMKAATSAVERSDVCALPAAGLVGEAVVALVLADAYAEKFGGDTIDDTLAAFGAFRRELRRR